MGSGCCSSFQQGEDDEGIRASGIQGEAEQTGPVLCGEGFLMICINGRREQEKRERRPLLSGVLHGSINGHKPKHMKIHLSTRKHFHCNCGHNQGQIAMRGCEAFIREDIQDLSGRGPGQCAQR